MMAVAGDTIDIDGSEDDAKFDLQLIGSDYDLTQEVVLAHSSVLSKHSIFFRDYLARNQPDAECLHLMPLIDTKTLSTVVDVMYNVMPIQGEEQFFIKGAKALEIDSLLWKKVITVEKDGLTENTGACNQEGSVLPVVQQSIPYDQDVLHIQHDNKDAPTASENKLSDMAVALVNVPNVTTTKCLHCNTYMSNRFELIRHMYCTHQDRPCFVCVICGCFFDMSYFLVDHFAYKHKIVATYHKLRSFGAIITSIGVKSDPQLVTLSGDVDKSSEQGALNHTWQLNNFLCLYCKRVFLFRNDLLRDMQEHLSTSEEAFDEKSYECHCCGELLENTKALEHHIFREHSGKSKCPTCHKKFNTALSLANHISGHSDKGRWHCELCGRCFKQKPHLKDHMYTHSDVYNFQCFKCGRMFRLKQALNYHLKVHHDPSFEPKWRCDACDKKLVTRSALLTHMKSHSRTRSEGFVCELCNTGFEEYSAVERHVEAVHNQTAKQ